MKHFLRIVLLLAIPASGAVPYVGYLYPCGIEAGTTNRLIVGGQFFGGIREGVVSGGGVKVLSIERVPNFPPPAGSQFRHLAKWLDGIAKGDPTEPPLPTGPNARLNEWRSNDWWRVLGTLDAQKRSLVERAMYVKRNPLQLSPSLSQRLLVTVAVDASATPGPREFRLVAPAGMSAPRLLEVSSAQRIQEPLYSPPHRRLPLPPAVADLPVVFDGQIMPGETDVWTLRLAAGRSVSIRAVARELQPYIGDAVPGFFNPLIRVLDGEGREIAFSDDTFFHPDPSLAFVPPADGEYSLEIHDVLYRGRDDFVYELMVDEGAASVDPRRVALWPNPVPRVPPEVRPFLFSGIVTPGGRPCEHVFKVDAPGVWRFDLVARRAGSPLDARITVLRNGSVVTNFSDTAASLFVGSIIQGECDPVGECRLKAGRYTVRVEDETGKGGSEWSYRLRVHPSAPDFEVWSSKSSFALRAGGGSAPVVMRVVRRGGFNGPVKLLGTEDFRFYPAVVPAGTNSIKTALVAVRKTQLDTCTIRPEASASIGGKLRRVYIQPADEYNQAFAWDHLLPARDFKMRVYGRPAQWRRPEKDKPVSPKKPAARNAAATTP